jgi:hypothetical protein
MSIQSSLFKKEDPGNKIKKAKPQQILPKGMYWLQTPCQTI